MHVVNTKKRLSNLEQVTDVGYLGGAPRSDSCSTAIGRRS